jgi:hypothetical protein
MEKSKLTETKRGETYVEQSQEHVRDFDIKWIIHKEFILAGLTVNSKYTVTLYAKLHENV